MLALANLFDMASTSIVVALLPIYAEQLGAGPVFLGLLFTFPTAASTLLSTPFGYLADRTSRKPWSVVGTIVGGLSVVGVGLARDETTRHPADGWSSNSLGFDGVVEPHRVRPGPFATERATEVQRGVDQADVTERLGKVTQVLAGLRVDLLGEQPEGTHVL